MTMRYYPIQERWQKIKRYLDDPVLKRVLRRDFNRYSLGYWDKPFTKDMLPEDIENFDWRLDYRRPHPPFWRYVKYGACHWIVNFLLRLAKKVEPTTPWRIVTSDYHSTVWDGDETLFEFNLLALGVSAGEAWAAAKSEGTKTFKLGKELRTLETPSVGFEYAILHYLADGRYETTAGVAKAIGCTKEFTIAILDLMRGADRVDVNGLGKKLVWSIPFDRNHAPGSPEFFVEAAEAFARATRQVWGGGEYGVTGRRRR